jgi:hypothetical protein
MNGGRGDRMGIGAPSRDGRNSGAEKSVETAHFRAKECIKKLNSFINIICHLIGMTKVYFLYFVYVLHIEKYFI